MKLLVTLLAICVFYDVVESCGNQGFPCIVENERYKNESDCPTKECYWNGEMCCAKNVGKLVESGERSLGFVPPPPQSSPKQLTKKLKELEKQENERSLGFFPPGPCKPPKKFPFNCVITQWTKYVVDPPVSVPYCVRIACSLDRRLQSVYDKDITQCGSQAGCYFDKELADFRKWNVPIMPGVPVCHYAIRSAVFHREAEKVKNLMGGWNPYFTQCIVDGEFKDEIEAGPPGCALLPLLNLFKIPPKMAGWGSINKRQCGLIDACYIPLEGCFYPVDLSNLVVKSGQKLLFNPREVVFGRPKCQNFDKSTPETLLKSYHKCLIAGCTVDANILADYNMLLFKVGNTLSPSDHWLFWEMAQVGKIAAHNMDSIYWPKQSNKFPTPPPTTKPAFSMPFNFPSIPSFPSTGGGKPMGGGTPGYPTSGSQQGCGFHLRSRGARPCAPPVTKPGPRIPHIYCPYNKVSFPKFDPLKGSTEGCCEVNDCYLSRKEIRKMHSGPTKYLSEWSVWTACSASCGGGIQIRKRSCVSVNKAVCEGNLDDERSCATDPCGMYTKWSPWTTCFTTCFGVQERYRTCIGIGCDGKESDSRPCPCPSG